MTSVRYRGIYLRDDAQPRTLAARVVSREIMAYNCGSYIDKVSLVMQVHLSNRILLCDARVGCY